MREGRPEFDRSEDPLAAWRREIQGLRCWVADQPRDSSAGGWQGVRRNRNGFPVGRDFADRLGVSKTVVNDLFNGRNVPGWTSFETILERLGLTPALWEGFYDFAHRQLKPTGAKAVDEKDPGLPAVVSVPQQRVPSRFDEELAASGLGATHVQVVAQGHDEGVGQGRPELVVRSAPLPHGRVRSSGRRPRSVVWGTVGLVVAVFAGAAILVNRFSAGLPCQGPTTTSTIVHFAGSYSGPVYIRVCAPPQSRPRDYRLLLRWGAKSRAIRLADVGRSGTAVLFTKSSAGTSFPLTVTVDPAARLSDGTGQPDGAIDIDAGWTKGSSGTAPTIQPAASPTQ
ncbi:MAG TPA: helix-turn-helix transcriptional regulator [Acidimicrobiales bacterium]|nr:helix-turn-helix transcriptional regulator [Acidimicrobiales bacterium]